MALKMRVRVTGADELTRRLNILGEQAKEVIEPAAKAGAEVIQMAASEKAPRGETGLLSELITYGTREKRPLKVTVDIGTAKEVFYGRFVELGHPLVRGSKKADKKVIGNVPPHPFLRPALDENKQEVKKVVAEEIRRRLKL